MPTKTMTDLGIDREAVEEALANNWTFPARWYSDSDIHALELEGIFSRSWQYAGPLSKLAQPGDHIVCQVGRVPILITRGRDGELHGFINVCRHRAFPVAVEDGNRTTLQCQYHAWTYDLDGSLRKAPRSEHEPDFDKSELCLLPVAVDTWNEFVFANPDPEAPPLREAFAGFPELASERGLDYTGYRYYGRYTYEVPANWKVWVENGSECYHCPSIHTGSFSDAFVTKLDVYEYVNRDRYLGQFTRYNPRAKRYKGVPPEGERQFRYVFLWPTTFLVQDDYVGFPGMIIPTGPESCRFISDMFVHPDADEEIVSQWTEMWNQTLEEDTEAVGLQQPGLRSQMVPHGRLMPASESAISRFHRMVWEEVAQALDRE
ncbi:MAG TPA: aromatic ring-hydroxylating dioxygenase subunit alpha [Solirubrobacteraceae bacterium]|nr:aromatic ring-hydroxylating dioxygenase subunit alpha [Solirubrobacteraceae bacterium]